MNRKNLLIGLAIFTALLFLERKQVGNLLTRISDYGRDFIKRLETLKLTAYPDAGGWSIGYGHYMGPTAIMKQIDATAAENLFAGDVQKAENIMARYIKVPLNQNQHDAVVSATFNLGAALFWNSRTGTYTHFLQSLNAGDYGRAAQELLGFNHSQGAVNPVLTARRQSEHDLFLS